ncbi:MAG: O-antigen ligase family protein [Solirubrobacteraceae bacterium]
MVVLLAWAASRGGFPVTRWYPGALGLLVVLASLAIGARPRLSRLARPLQVALVAMVLYTAWSYASISWAAAPGVAWDGANRTLLYLVIFATMAFSSLGARRAAVVLCTWTLGIAALAVWVLLALPNPIGGGPGAIGRELEAPTGYSNAQACLWFMAAWPALMLAARQGLPPALRGILAGAVVVLVDVALLSGSRGSLVAAAICLAGALVAFNGRARTLLTLVPVGAAIALTSASVLDVAADLRRGGPQAAQLDAVAGAPLGAALLVALVVGLLALAETLRPPAAHVKLRLRRAVGTVAVAAVVVAISVAALGDPLGRIDSQWDSFSQTTPDGRAGSREGLTGGRHDFYRVSLDIIGEHPLLGLGADNFAKEYARRGATSEFPAYTHSLPLRALVHTGAIGALLLALALGAAALAACRAARHVAVPTAAVASAATMVAAHWFVQGAADWFWEFPALGGAAFAMLGLAGGLAPGREPTRAPSRAVRAAAGALGAVAALAAAASLTLPWMSAILVQRAGDIWPTAPQAAFRQLGVAADLNALSVQPPLIEGTIALRLGRLDRARAAFETALEREPDEAYALLALGAIASERGDEGRALGLVVRAEQLNPQQAVTTVARAQLRAGQRFDTRMLLERLAALGRALRF